MSGTAVAPSLQPCDTGTTFPVFGATVFGERFTVGPGAGPDSITVQPADTLDRRYDVYPIARRRCTGALGTYDDLNLTMGRISFPAHAGGEQTYRAFSNDPSVSIDAVFLTAESSEDTVQEKRDVNEVVHHFMRDHLALDVPPAEDVFAALAPVYANALGMMDFGELAWIYMLARGRVETTRSIVEIGSFQGLSTSALAAATRGDGPDVHLVSIDPHMDVPQRHTVVRANVEATGEGARLVQIQSSPETITDLIAPDAASMVFIDGDHAFDAVIRDLECADRWLMPGGWMVLHDYWPVEHLAYELHPSICDTPHAIRESAVLRERYEVLGAVKSTIAFRKRD